MSQKWVGHKTSAGTAVKFSWQKAHLKSARATPPQRRAPAVIKHKRPCIARSQKAARPQSYLRRWVAEPSSNRRRPSIINPALSSQGSSHNMSPRVILTFFFFLPASFSLPSTHHPDLSLLPRGPLWERSLWSTCVSLAARLKGLGKKNHTQNNGSGEGVGKKVFFSCFRQSLFLLFRVS